MKLEWNAIYYDFNAKKITTFNIFDHGRFREEIYDNKKKSKTKEEFEKSTRMSLMYYFWSKSEYEVIVSPWIGDDKAAIKIDIYTQVINNWDIFIDYVWNNL